MISKITQTFLLVAVITLFSANSQNLEVEDDKAANVPLGKIEERTEAEKDSNYENNSNVILNLPLTNLRSITDISPFFGFQYSYNQHNGYPNNSPNPRYFQITQQGLQINIYAGDQTFSPSSPTSPRTELRGTGVLGKISDNRVYQISFDHFISNYPSSNPPYEFCWMQLFGATGPNVLLRFKYGKYELCVKHVSCLHLPNTLSKDIGQWVQWKMEFLLANSGGFVSVFRNSVLLGTSRGNTSGGNNSYFKHGIYTQGIHPPGTMTTFTKNLIFTSNQSQITPAEPESKEEGAFLQYLQDSTYEDNEAFTRVETAIQFSLKSRIGSRVFGIRLNPQC